MSPSLTQLLIVLAIVVLIFGTKKLRNMGGDLGSAIKNFKSSMKDGEAEANKTAERLSADDASAPKPESEKSKTQV